MLTQIQINSLKSLFNPMTKSELDEVLEMVLEEAFKRDWSEEFEDYVWEARTIRES